VETSDLQSLRHARHHRLKERLKDDPDNQDFSALFAPALREEFEFMADTDLANGKSPRLSLRSESDDFRSGNQLLVEQFQVPGDLLHWCLDARSAQFVHSL
jgi:hypothetical protein